MNKNHTKSGLITNLDFFKTLNSTIVYFQFSPCVLVLCFCHKLEAPKLAFLINVTQHVPKLPPVTCRKGFISPDGNLLEGEPEFMVSKLVILWLPLCLLIV